MFVTYLVPRRINGRLRLVPQPVNIQARDLAHAVLIYMRARAQRNMAIQLYIKETQK